MLRTLEYGLLARDARAMQQPRDPAARAAARQRFVERLGTLHGLPQKVAQILSLRDLGQGEVPTALLYGETLPVAESLGRIEDALGAPLGDCFADFCEDGIAASIGQVHRAELHDGRPVAVKLQYPEVSKWLASDLRTIGWMTAPLGMLTQGFDVAAYRRELGARLLEELDYRREVEMMKRFALFFRSESRLRFPTPVEGLCTSEVITATWLEGERSPRGSAVALERYRDGLVTLFWRSALRHLLLHADPNPGNFVFGGQDASAFVGVLDFGCVKELDASSMSALRFLVQHGLEGRAFDADLALSGLGALGFHRDALVELSDVVGPLTALLLEPITGPQPFVPEQYRLGERVSALLGARRATFRQAGSAGLSFFVRTWAGLLAHLGRLGGPVSMRALYEQAVDRLPPAALPATSASADGPATLLRVRVQRGGRTTAQISLGAHVVRHLRDVVPDDVRDEVERRGIDLDVLAVSALESGLVPQDLFCLDEPDRTIRVWLG